MSLAHYIVYDLKDLAPANLLATGFRVCLPILILSLICLAAVLRVRLPTPPDTTVGTHIERLTRAGLRLLVPALPIVWSLFLAQGFFYAFDSIAYIAGPTIQVTLAIYFFGACLVLPPVLLSLWLAPKDILDSRTVRSLCVILPCVCLGLVAMALSLLTGYAS